MSTAIQLHTSTFGKPADNADCLILEISPNTIAFSELNSAQNALLYVCEYPIDTNSIIPIHEHVLLAVKHFQFAKNNYSTVYVMLSHAQFTLCPIHFYNQENLRSILEFNVGSVNNQLVQTDDISHDIKLIYAVEEQLKSTLNNIFPNHHLNHSISISAKLMLNSEELTKESILLAVHANYIEVIVKQEQKLLLANQYATKTDEDILYFVLFILEQYQLNPLLVNVTVTGNIKSDTDLITSLKKYIKNVRLARGHKSLNWQAVSGMPQHFYYTLSNRLFCE